MWRITVYGNDGDWSFRPGASTADSWPSALKAASAAVEFGDTLEGTSLGCIVRLPVETGTGASNSVPLEMRVFDPRDARPDRAPP